MNSRFKFRAWNKSEGKMYVNVQFRRDDYVFGDACADYAQTACFLAENLIIMQCTGLTDKNGRDIYEGDVVTHSRRAPHGDIDCVVTWGGAGYSLFAARSNPDKGENAGDLLTWWYTGDMAVIGNIYENPELVEVDND